MAYKSKVLFFFTKYTPPKAPYPSGLMNSKSRNPIANSLYTLSAFIL